MAVPEARALIPAAQPSVSGLILALLAGLSVSAFVSLWSKFFLCEVEMARLIYTPEAYGPLKTATSLAWGERTAGPGNTGMITLLYGWTTAECSAACLSGVKPGMWRLA